MSKIEIILMFLSLGCIGMSLTIIHNKLSSLKDEIEELKKVNLELINELIEDEECQQE